MEEPVRLVCPECDAVHRVKNLTLGRKYQCKKCGAGLVTLEPMALSCPACGAVTEPAHVDVSRQTHCRECQASPALAPVSPAGEIMPAASPQPASAEYPPPSPAPQSTVSGRIAPAGEQSNPGRGELEKQLKRLNALSDAIADRLDLLRESEVGPLVKGVEETSRKLLDFAVKFDADMESRSGELAEKSARLETSITELSAKLDLAAVRALSESIRETGDLFLRHLDEAKAGQATEIASAVRETLDGYKPDFDNEAISSGLTKRIVKGVEEAFRARNEREDRLLVPLARVSEELVTGQEEAAVRLDRLSEGLSENWGRLEPLMSDIKAAATRTLAAPEPEAEAENIAGKVSEDVTKRIESRLSATIANSLAMQAPQFVNAIQDERLEEVVLRAAREAQRPLSREVAALGGRGVPVWLFGSVLFPLLAVLVYLLLPGEPAGPDVGAPAGDNREISAQLGVIDKVMREEVSTRLEVIDGMMREMYSKADAHARNSATLAERVRTMEQDLLAQRQVVDEQKRHLAANVKTIEEFNDAIRKLTWQNQAYEAHLRRLGVNPDTVPNVQPPGDSHAQAGPDR